MIVIAKLKAVNGKEEEMKKAILEVMPKVSEEEGTLIYTLNQNQNDPTEFLFYEKYTDMEALMTHSATPYFKALFKTLAPMLDGNAEIVTYDEVAGI